MSAQPDQVGARAMEREALIERLRNAVEEAIGILRGTEWDTHQAEVSASDCAEELSQSLDAAHLLSAQGSGDQPRSREGWTLIGTTVYDTQAGTERFEPAPGIREQAQPSLSRESGTALQAAEDEVKRLQPLLAAEILLRIDAQTAAIKSASRAEDAERALSALSMGSGAAVREALEQSQKLLYAVNGLACQMHHPPQDDGSPSPDEPVHARAIASMTAVQIDANAIVLAALVEQAPTTDAFESLRETFEAVLDVKNRWEMLLLSVYGPGDEIAPGYENASQVVAALRAELAKATTEPKTCATCETVKNREWQLAVAKDAAERGHANQKVVAPLGVPQLLFAPFLFALQAAIEALHEAGERNTP